MQRDPMLRKMLAAGIIALFVGTSITASAEQNARATPAQPKLRGDILHVGGSGPGNYSKIQDAIDDAHDGDTVFVYSGVYDERLSVQTAIRLIGESRNTTIITNTSDNESLISLYTDDITISEFTLRLYGNFGYDQSIISKGSPYEPDESIENITISQNILQVNTSEGIHLLFCNFSTIAHNIFYLNSTIGIEAQFANNCTFTNNLFNGDPKGGYGIQLHYCTHSIVSNNSFNSNYWGLFLVSADFSTVSNNYFIRNQEAIYLESSRNNSIIANRIENTKERYWYYKWFAGIHVTEGSFWNIIEKNFISQCGFGVFLSSSYETVISMNTFMNNAVHARFSETLGTNLWDRNYWGRPRVLPKPIFGIKGIYLFYPGFIQFDWHPAQEPYNISEIGRGI